MIKILNWFLSYLDELTEKKENESERIKIGYKKRSQKFIDYN